MASRGSTDRVRIEHHLATANEDSVRDEVRQALEETPRRLPTRFFYDDRGSALFEAICELPEYYQTRTESKLLARVADRIVAVSGADELVELGSGAATKTRILLDAMKRSGRLRCFVPVDVSEGIVRRTANELAAEYPGLRVHGLVADFMSDLGELPPSDSRLVVFLGGTIGNLEPSRQGVPFLRHLRASMAASDHLLIGVDLIKDPAIIEAAYNDSQGVTADFNRNILRVVNARFDADFVPERFRHRAFYNRDRDWIEMRLVSEVAQTVRLADLGLTFALARGEELLTEISAKFDRVRLERLLTASGFSLEAWHTEDALFALGLARVAAA